MLNKIPEKIQIKFSYPTVSVYSTVSQFDNKQYNSGVSRGGGGSGASAGGAPPQTPGGFAARM